MVTKAVIAISRRIFVVNLSLLFYFEHVHTLSSHMNAVLKIGICELDNQVVPDLLLSTDRKFLEGDKRRLSF